MENNQNLPLWNKKTAVITGASSGIGTRLAQHLAQRGLNIVAAARRKDRLETLKNQIEDAGGRCLAVQCDMRNDANIRSLFEQTERVFGGTDILVNNAGLGFDAPLISGHSDAWRETMDVNVIGLSIATQIAIQSMIQNKTHGYIIHISSMAAHRVPSNSGMYAASKFAVRALTESLRQELWEEDLPIRVSAISPAYVETEFAEKYSGDEEKAKSIYNAYRVLQTEDIASAVHYLLPQPLDVQVHDILLRPRRQQN